MDVIPANYPSFCLIIPQFTGSSQTRFTSFKHTFATFHGDFRSDISYFVLDTREVIKKNRYYHFCELFELKAKSRQIQAKFISISSKIIM